MYLSSLSLTDRLKMSESELVTEAFGLICTLATSTAQCFGDQSDIENPYGSAASKTVEAGITVGLGVMRW